MFKNYIKDKVKLETPLVSIIVISFNSSKFIIETLDSIVNQTYKNIELIICDDCSTDNTTSIISNWIKENKVDFNIKLNFSNINNGISGNLQIGIEQSNGIWIKPIAADDILMPYTIEKFIDYVINYDSISVFSSDILCFGTKHFDQTFIDYINSSKTIANKNKSFRAQYRILKFNNFIFAPTIFYKKSAIDEIGGMDLEIPNLDDWPLLLNFTKNKFRIFYIDLKLVKYRLHDESVQKSKKINYSYSIFKYKYQYSSILYKIFAKILNIPTYSIMFNRLFFFSKIFYKIQYRIFKIYFKQVLMSQY